MVSIKNREEWNNPYEARSNGYWENWKANAAVRNRTGSTSMMLDTSGNVMSTMLHKPWGETRYTSGAASTDYKYTRQLQVDIGIYYYGARFYDPYLNRWTQPDSIIPLESQVVQAWDRYAYSNNNPINRIDPTGHWSFTVIYNVSGIVCKLNVKSIWCFRYRCRKRVGYIFIGVRYSSIRYWQGYCCRRYCFSNNRRTAGAGLAAPEGGALVVVTGPGGALLGAGLFELNP